MKLHIGYKACYIRDYRATHVCDIPSQTALDWAKHTVGECTIGYNQQFSDIVDPTDWLNKMFVIVDCEHGNWVALYNHDGTFSVRLISTDAQI